MQKCSDLSDIQKGTIIGFRAKGGSISETANFVNCSRAALLKVYRAWQYGTIQNQRHGTCGAPRATDDRGERRLRRCVWANRRATDSPDEPRGYQECILNNGSANVAAHGPPQQMPG
ncbi:hypothetical protein AVEN_54727-1 [Araneus ventricosus]|uniref:Tc3 transposase DNA binding domain-containing protein n=1 Tax=Araneus ventricosus TaxID=182803 RepID=A0A4Y2FEL4_ARAVE|nr:hypothetical protein AVEN_54727-1 [Araneus ventricosus]